MKLDKRLLVCAEMTEGSFVCDIGTDHGYLPAYLLRSGKCTKAIARYRREATCCRKGYL